MKRILPLLIGLILGMAGGTGYVLFVGGAEATPEGEAHAATELAPDSTGSAHSEGEEGTEAMQGAESTDSETEHLAAVGLDTAQVQPEPPLGSAAGDLVRPEQLAELIATTPEAEDVVSDTTPAETQDDPAGPAPLTLVADEDGVDEPAKRLAKIFGTMQARDAARVLALLRHDEIERILRQLDARAAAKILSSLDAELAAALSSTLIHGVRER